MLLVRARAVKRDLLHGCQVYKNGKQLTLEEVDAEITHLEEMDRRSAIGLRKGMVG